MPDIQNECILRDARGHLEDLLAINGPTPATRAIGGALDFAEGQARILAEVRDLLRSLTDRVHALAPHVVAHSSHPESEL